MFTALIDTLASAIDALADFDEQYAIRAGLDPAQVREWAGLHKVYFGATSCTGNEHTVGALECSRGRYPVLSFYNDCCFQNTRTGTYI